MLPALAAGEMRHERKTPCCRAAEQPAIRAGGSMVQAANLQVADETAVRYHCLEVCFRPLADHIEEWRPAKRFAHLWT